MQGGLAWLHGTALQRSGEDMTWEYRERVGISTVAGGECWVPWTAQALVGQLCPGYTRVPCPRLPWQPTGVVPCHPMGLKSFLFVKIKASQWSPCCLLKAAFKLLPAAPGDSAAQ